MLKKSIVLLSLSLILLVAVPVSAQTNSGCGFWGKLFGTCSDQSANVLNARMGSSTKDARPAGMKMASSTKPLSAEQIQCVGSAVATRESSLSTAMNTFNQSINTAYATRASELATAYSKTNVTELRAGISVAWKNFNSTTKNAQKAWKTAKETAWKTFKTNAKSCGTSNESLSDTANSVTEMSGS